MPDVSVHLVETITHGRVLVREALQSRDRVIVGFHGYAENAAVVMQRLQNVPGSGDWQLIAVQGLNRFYRGRTQETVAGWMTREDRETAIADNIRYVDAALDSVLDAVRHVQVVTSGFSQGVAMSFRAAVRGRRPCDAVIAVGGDVPPELLADPAACFPRVLLIRGDADEWYTQAKLDADTSALRSRGVDVTAQVVPAGHEWNPDVDAAVSVFLERLRSGRA
jgi:predicted esterase